MSRLGSDCVKERDINWMSEVDFLEAVTVERGSVMEKVGEVS
jgi:hypothetical protein